MGRCLATNIARALQPSAIALVVGVAISTPALANDLRVETGSVERVAGSNTLRVHAKVSWKNAWRNARNYDAVWLFVKIRPGPNAPWRHARLASTPGNANAPIACDPSADRVGAFCRAGAATHRGDLAGDVVLELDPASLPNNVQGASSLEARVFGIEMVYVPDGPFSVGDRDTASVAHAAFYRSNANGGHGGPYRITSEAAIKVAPEDGALYYRSAYPQYEGDRAGPIPAECPKGTRAFYIMKYEIL